MRGFATGGHAHVDTGFRRDLLRLYREEAGLTQAGLAAAMGRNCGPVICAWEVGRRKPSPSNIAALAAALGISPAALCEDPDE